MPNKTGRKKLSSEKITVILTLHKLGYTASQINREEGLTKTDNYLLGPTREKAVKMTSLSKPFKLGDLLS
jgi:hypothetical protein